MHMELAAMYGPVIEKEGDLDQACISYRTQFNVEAQKFESMRSVLTKAKADLLKAQDLLKEDPIVGINDMAMGILLCSIIIPCWNVGAIG